MCLFSCNDKEGSFNHVLGMMLKDDDKIIKAGLFVSFFAIQQVRVQSVGLESRS